MLKSHEQVRLQLVVKKLIEEDSCIQLQTHAAANTHTKSQHTQHNDEWRAWLQIRVRQVSKRITHTMNSLAGGKSRGQTGDGQAA